MLKYILTGLFVLMMYIPTVSAEHADNLPEYKSTQSGEQGYTSFICLTKEDVQEILSKAEISDNSEMLEYFNSYIEKGNCIRLQTPILITIVVRYNEYHNIDENVYIVLRIRNSVGNDAYTYVIEKKGTEA